MKLIRLNLIKCRYQTVLDIIYMYIALTLGAAQIYEIFLIRSCCCCCREQKDDGKLTGGVMVNKLVSHDYSIDVGIEEGGGTVIHNFNFL